MARRVKQKRGYYRELKKEIRYLKSINVPAPEPMHVIECWLKHNENKDLDIRVYARFDNENDLTTTIAFLSKFKEGYSDAYLMRFHDRPTTRKQKAIYKSIFSDIPHISELI